MLDLRLIGSANSKYHNEDGFDIVTKMVIVAIVQKRREDSNPNIATIII